MKNFAYGRRILLDQSFSGGILICSWDAYGHLLAGMYEDEGVVSTEDAETIGAGLRQQIVDAATVSKVQQAILDERLEELHKDIEKLLSTPAKRRAELVKTARCSVWLDCGRCTPQHTCLEVGPVELGAARCCGNRDRPASV